MIAAENSNTHGDAHGAALARSRKRAALAAWDAAVRASRANIAGEASIEDYDSAADAWVEAAESIGLRLLLRPAVTGCGA